MQNIILLSTAAGIGIAHTALGPDHYLPFIAMSRAAGWTLHRTIAVTVLCGIGHVASSVLIATLGAVLGYSLGHIELIQSFQGKIAAWLLIGFGLAYFAWGLRHAYLTHSHAHRHKHHSRYSPDSLTPWVLFSIFIFGPCEALIPLLMYPAAKSSSLLALLVIVVFAAATIATMVLVVAVSSLGFRMGSFGRTERFSHALAGLMIVICGAGIHWLGW